MRSSAVGTDEAWFADSDTVRELPIAGSYGRCELQQTEGLQMNLGRCDQSNVLHAKIETCRNWRPVTKPFVRLRLHRIPLRPGVTKAYVSEYGLLPYSVRKPLRASGILVGVRR
jgi:hypothetical protein